MDLGQGSGVVSGNLGPSLGEFFSRWRAAGREGPGVGMSLRVPGQGGDHWHPSPREGRGGRRPGVWTLLAESHRL